MSFFRFKGIGLVQEVQRNGRTVNSWRRYSESDPFVTTGLAVLTSENRLTQLTEQHRTRHARLVLISSGFLLYGWRMARPVVKLSVNLPPGDVAVIRELAKKRSTTMTEVIRRGIGLQKYWQEVLDKGGKVLVEDRRGRLREVVI